MKDRDAAIVSQVKDVFEDMERIDRSRKGAARIRSCYPCHTCKATCSDSLAGMCPACWKQLKELAEKGARDGSRMAANAGMDHQLSTKGATDEQ